MKLRLSSQGFVVAYRIVSVFWNILKICQIFFWGDRVPQPPIRKIFKKYCVWITIMCWSPPSLVHLFQTVSETFDFWSLWNSPNFSKSVKFNFPEIGEKNRVSGSTKPQFLSFCTFQLNLGLVDFKILPVGGLPIWVHFGIQIFGNSPKIQFWREILLTLWAHRSQWIEFAKQATTPNLVSVTRHLTSKFWGSRGFPPNRHGNYFF